VKVVNQVFATMGLSKHQYKTFIGRIEKGFDWLGYHFGSDGLSVATKTIETSLPAHAGFMSTGGGSRLAAPRSACTCNAGCGR